MTLCQAEPCAGAGLNSLCTLVGEGDLVEGCYIQERILDVPPAMSRQDREFFHLDPQAPVRVLDVAFSYSPINSSNRQVQNAPAIIADKLEYIQIYIQDETEPVLDALERANELPAPESKIADGVSTFH